MKANMKKQHPGVPFSGRLHSQHVEGSGFMPDTTKTEKPPGMTNSVSSWYKYMSIKAIQFSFPL